MTKPNLILTVAEAEKDHEKWLQVRNQGIGGSDAGVILGLNPYKSRLSLWLEKTGQAQPEDLSDNERVYWGKNNEPMIARYFEEKTGKHVRRCGTMQNGDYPWMLANVDRLIDGEQAGLEIKTAGVSQYKLWEGDEIPDMYYAQCQHYMMVTGLDMWYICVLIGGNEGRIKEVPRNQEFIDDMFAAEQEFWKCVEERVMPEVDGMPDTATALNEMYPQAETDSYLKLETTDKLEDIFERYARYKELMEELTQLKAECENKIKVLMGDNELCIIGDGDTQHKVTWKNVAGRTTIDTKRLQKDHPDIFEEYKKVGKPTRRFSM